MPMTFPMILTLLRIALIPVLVLFFYLPYSWASFAAAAVFIFAAITDWADGYLARRMGLMSELGAFLDPVADLVVQLCWERSGPDPGGVGFGNPNHRIDFFGSDPRAAAGVSGQGIRRGHKRIGAMVYVKMGPLGALKQDLPSGINSVVYDN